MVRGWLVGRLQIQIFAAQSQSQAGDGDRDSRSSVNLKRNRSPTIDHYTKPTNPIIRLLLRGLDARERENERAARLRRCACRQPSVSFRGQLDRVRLVRVWGVKLSSRASEQELTSKVVVVGSGHVLQQCALLQRRFEVIANL
uniref:(northern house mosquito) hypothetical protein n=1 Tax=Culex pipiens TaxID=7175 RepID=A0A8D8DVG2_CULPI